MVLKNPSEYEKGKTIVYFVRHGDRKSMKNSPGAGLRIPGPSLSPLGKKQAKDVAKKLSKISHEVDKLYSSTMARAIETAEEISKSINKKITKHEELSEFNQFLWKNRYYHKNFWKHYFLMRKAVKKFNQILKENEGKVIVIVAHGNVIKGLIGKKLGLRHNQISKLDYHNCNITKARFRKNKKLGYVYYFNSKDLS